MNNTLRFAALLTVLFTAGVAGMRSSAQAETMNSSDYTVQMGTLNITSGTKSGGSYILTDTVGQTSPGQYDSAGYIVRSGFQYMYAVGRFSFSISDLTIDLGTLSSTAFATGTHTLTVSAVGAGGYSVTAAENHPLRQINGSNTIPDTNCDSSCSETTAAVWIVPGNEGFGYNMSGNDIPSAFVNSSYFKQFADLSASEIPQVVMSSVTAGQNRQATVTYKASVRGSQAAGNYENAITYVATPGY